MRGVSLAASGDRLLISLRVKANEKRSWFGLGAEATVYVWGRPVLDTSRQILRLTDIALDVESEAAFGILGAAARATAPYLEAAVAENAVVRLVGPEPVAWGPMRMGLIVPNMLTLGDFGRLAGLAAPRVLMVVRGLGTDGQPLPPAATTEAFAPARAVYGLHDADDALMLLERAEDVPRGL